MQSIGFEISSANGLQMFGGLVWYQRAEGFFTVVLPSEREDICLHNIAIGHHQWIDRYILAARAPRANKMSGGYNGGREKQSEKDHKSSFFCHIQL